jgi:hypothetical protein
VGDGFKYNEVKCDLISIDFSTATKVYEPYDKTILTDSSSGLRLSYVSSVGPTLTFAGILS